MNPYSFISDILEYTDKMNIPCYMFAADIEKAFDSVSHAFLISVLKKLDLVPTLFSG